MFTEIWEYLKDNEHLGNAALADTLMSKWSFHFTTAIQLVMSFRTKRYHYCIAINLDFGDLRVEEFDDINKAKEWVGESRAFVIVMQYEDANTFNLFYIEDGKMTKPVPGGLAKIRNALWNSKLFPSAFGAAVEECFKRKIPQNETQLVLEKAKLDNVIDKSLEAYSKEY